MPTNYQLELRIFTLTMFAYKQALTELSSNAIVMHFVKKMESKLKQDSKYSYEGMKSYFAELVAEQEHTNAKERILRTGIKSLDIDWETLDFKYYHMAFRIIAVQKYNQSEYMKKQEFEEENKALLILCSEAYNRLLNNSN